MRAVKSKGNRSTEQKLVDFFKLYSIKGWRRNFSLLGKPDFVFPTSKVAVFVDGCFWHGHDCRNTKPKQNAKYWQTKIRKNRARDRFVTKTLIRQGWSVRRIWECKLLKKNHATLAKCFKADVNIS